MPSITCIQPNLARTPAQEENFQKQRGVTEEMEQAVKQLQAMQLLDGEEMMEQDPQRVFSPSTTPNHIPRELPSRKSTRYGLLLLNQALIKNAKQRQRLLHYAIHCKNHKEHSKLNIMATQKPTRHDAAKLKTFLDQLLAVLRANPPTYLSDTSEGTRTGFHHNSIGFAWYQQQSFPKVYPDWFFNLDLLKLAIRPFNKELNEADAAHVAARGIRALRVCDDGNIHKYVERFENLSADLEWNEAALLDQFRSGLCKRIRDEIHDMDRAPATLYECVNTSIYIDSLHVERQGANCLV